MKRTRLPNLSGDDGFSASRAALYMRVSDVRPNTTFQFPINAVSCDRGAAQKGTRLLPSSSNWVRPPATIAGPFSSR